MFFIKKKRTLSNGFHRTGHLKPAVVPIEDGYVSRG